MSKMVRAFGLVAGLAVVIVPACGGNGDTIGSYVVDGSVLTDVAVDDTGMHIMPPDAHTVKHPGSGYPEASTQDVWQATSYDTGAPDTGSGSGTGVGDAMTCPSRCTTNAQCQSTCPAAPSGSQNCCDTATSQCFQSVTPSCPGTVHPSDSGSDVY
jgi:hypothetical protein